MTSTDLLVVRFGHQCGVGLDPLKHQSNHANRPRHVRYYRGNGNWHGGPETAARFRTKEEANQVISIHGHRKAYGDSWLGHCDDCEVVTLEQALKDEVENI